jgi:hypothetical protein
MFDFFFDNMQAKEKPSSSKPSARVVMEIEKDATCKVVTRQMHTQERLG